MCGIFCVIHNYGSTTNSQSALKPKQLELLLQRRGPNSAEVLHYENITFAGYVLWQQGAMIKKQPVVSENIVLLFNGDIFNIGAYFQLPPETSDTEWLATALNRCQTDEEICEMFAKIEGPFSIIFYRKDTKEIYFGRDSLGRNSLIMELDEDEKQLRILSTSFIENREKCKVIEVPPKGLFKLNIDNIAKCKVLIWRSSVKNDDDLNLSDTAAFFETIQLGEISPKWLQVSNNLKESFNFYDLIRRHTSQPSSDIFAELLKCAAIKIELEKFSYLLKRSVKDRVERTRECCKACMRDNETETTIMPVKCKHAKVAILFSGGLDCAILAILADKFIAKTDAIDLINVAFELKHLPATESPSQDLRFEVPDRISAKHIFKELQQICPNRQWNLIEVNVTRAELEHELHRHIKHLIYPNNTVLDESLGCSFWFAARGIGRCGDVARFESHARVILVGNGADELFGGYSRHRKTYMRCIADSEKEKLSKVDQELELDWQRLPSRNLARDDRIIADNGCTSRAPYIEEHLVQFIRGLKASQRCCFLLKEGIGDKLFLRLYGYQIGLREACTLKKRAIQFGSRIANKNQNGHDISDSLR